MTTLGRVSREDLLAKEAYELYLGRIHSWLQDLEIGVHGQPFRFSSVIHQIIPEEEETEDEEDDEFMFEDEQMEVEEEEEEGFLVWGDGRKDDVGGVWPDTLDFNVDNLLNEVVEDYLNQRSRRKALDLGFSRPSMEMDPAACRTAAGIQGEMEACAQKESRNVAKRMGFIGMALGLAAFVLRR